MSSDIRCPKCGAVNASTSTFCALCGGPLAAAPQPQPQAGGWPPQQPMQPQQPYPGQQQPYPGQQYPGQPPQGYPGGYPPPQGGYPPQQPQNQGKALIALILAIVGFLICGPFTAVPAIFMAKSDLDAMKRGALPTTNQTMAQVAFWMGIGVTALWVLFLCAGFGFGFLGAIGENL